MKPVHHSYHSGLNSKAP